MHVPPSSCCRIILRSWNHHFGWWSGTCWYFGCSSNVKDAIQKYKNHLSEKQDQLLKTFFKSQEYTKLYSYHHLLNGFAVKLTAKQVWTLLVSFSTKLSLPLPCFSITKITSSTDVVAMLDVLVLDDAWWCLRTWCFGACCDVLSVYCFGNWCRQSCSRKQLEWLQSRKATRWRKQPCIHQST